MSWAREAAGTPQGEEISVSQQPLPEMQSPISGRKQIPTCHESLMWLQNCQHLECSFYKNSEPVNNVNSTAQTADDNLDSGLCQISIKP